MRIRFHPTPYTLVSVPGFTNLWDAPERHDTGVYLWCIECQGAYLVNYVGMTVDRRGFEGRLWDELKDWRAGLYTSPVDIEQWKTGRKVLLHDASSDHRARQLAEFQPLYRILLASIEKDQPMRQVESFIVNKLIQQPESAQFVTNKNPERYKAPPIKIEVISTLPIIGLTAPLPDALH